MQANIALTTLVEVALNTLLFSSRHNSSQIKSARRRLVGKVLCLEITELAQPMMIIFSQQQIDVLSDWQGDIDCTVKAPINVLLKIKQQQNVTTLIRNHQLEVSGDSQLLQQLMALAELVDWDLADYLAPYIGDIAAYGISTHAQSLAKFTHSWYQKQKSNLQEVAKEEWFMLPNPLELAHFSDCVTEFAHDVDMIANRMDKILAK